MGIFLMKEIIRKIIKSWSATEGNVNSTAQILDWVAALNRDARVSIKECESGDNSFWFYDDYVGEIHNRKRSFFSITGIQRYENLSLIHISEPTRRTPISYAVFCLKKKKRPRDRQK